MLFLAMFFIAGIAKIKASTAENGRGWLWGGSEEVDDRVINGNETGVYLVSLNSANCDTNGDGRSDATSSPCPAVGTAMQSYGVYMDPSSRILSGYAWAETLGWISFNAADVSGCPVPNGTGECVAKKIADKKMDGWARIIGIRDAGANAGGWQGWIRLSGINYGVNVNDDGSIVAGSYAWSDELGWIDFSGGSFDTRVLQGYISANPSVADSAAPVIITAFRQDSSTTTGVLTYELDCANDGTFEKKAENITENSYTFTDTCSYTDASNVVAVRITQQGISTIATTPVMVGCIEYTCDSGTNTCTAGSIRTSGTCTTIGECNAACSPASSLTNRWREVSPW